MKKRELFRGYSILDVLAWVGFLIVVLYLVGKVIGLIHSPWYIDLTAIGGATYFVGRYAQKIDIIFEDSKEIKKDLDKIKANCPSFKK